MFDALIKARVTAGLFLNLMMEDFMA